MTPLKQAWGSPTALRDIVQELGNRLDASDQQMIPSAGARDVQQVPFGVVDFLQVRIVADRLDALLQRE